MIPESPLDQVKRHFKTFKVEPPKTINADRVLIEQEVAFKKECREEANETLTIHTIMHDMTDEDMTYLMLKEAVDGPITDGNRIQKVNDCEIRTYVDMIDYKDRLKEIPSTKKAPIQSQKPVSSSTPPAKASVNAGCRSEGASLILFPIIILLVIMKRKFSTAI